MMPAEDYTTPYDISIQLLGEKRRFDRPQTMLTGILFLCPPKSSGTIVLITTAPLVIAQTTSRQRIPMQVGFWITANEIQRTKNAC